MGELIRTPRGNKYLLVMCDRFSKLVRTRPLKRVTALAVAEAFVTHWVLVYGPPADLLSDNGSQFASRLFISICRILGVKNKFTTTYHPQCNGQVERFNRTVLQALRHYVADHPKDWDLFTDALTYAYNTQVHNSTGCTPFELVLSKPPSSLALEALPTLKGEPTSVYHERWTRRLEALMSTAKRELRKAQKRYRRNNGFPLGILNPMGTCFSERITTNRKSVQNTSSPRWRLDHIRSYPFRIRRLSSRSGNATSACLATASRSPPILASSLPGLPIMRNIPRPQWVRLALLVHSPLGFWIYHPHPLWIIRLPASGSGRPCSRKRHGTVSQARKSTRRLFTGRKPIRLREPSPMM